MDFFFLNQSYNFGILPVFVITLAFSFDTPNTTANTTFDKIPYFGKIRCTVRVTVMIFEATH